MTSPSNSQIEGYDPSRDDFLAFYASGGVVNIWDWMMFPDSWKALMVSAKQQVEIERAVSVGISSTSEGVAALLRPYDGGRAACQIALSGAMSRWESERT